jgi:hypothetical protein
MWIQFDKSPVWTCLNLYLSLAISLTWTDLYGTWLFIKLCFAVHAPSLLGSHILYITGIQPRPESLKGEQSSSVGWGAWVQGRTGPQCHPKWEGPGRPWLLIIWSKIVEANISMNQFLFRNWSSVGQKSLLLQQSILNTNIFFVILNKVNSATFLRFIAKRYMSILNFNRNAFWDKGDFIVLWKNLFAILLWKFLNFQLFTWAFFCH